MPRPGKCRGIVENVNNRHVEKLTTRILLLKIGILFGDAQPVRFWHNISDFIPWIRVVQHTQDQTSSLRLMQSLLGLHRIPYHNEERADGAKEQRCEPPSSTPPSLGLREASIDNCQRKPTNGVFRWIVHNVVSLKFRFSSQCSIAVQAQLNQYCRHAHWVVI